MHDFKKRLLRSRYAYRQPIHTFELLQAQSKSRITIIIEPLSISVATWTLHMLKLISNTPHPCRAVLHYLIVIDHKGD